MPYQFFYDSDELPEDEDGGHQRNSRAFSYEGAQAGFDPVSLKGVAAVIYRALIESGATRMRVTYDGGNDEGFAYADDVWLGSDPISCEKAVDLLSTPPIEAELRKAAGERGGSYWGDAAKMYVREKPAKLALDELAHALASALLGDGFGTGEYELYGALMADLQSGDLQDSPDASMPEKF